MAKQSTFLCFLNLIISFEVVLKFIKNLMVISKFLVLITKFLNIAMYRIFQEPGKKRLLYT